MSWRIGLGPVFFHELVATGRRWQTYALRTGLLVAMLIALMMQLAIDDRFALIGTPHSTSIKQYAGWGNAFATTILFAQLAFVMVAAPAAAAGSICLDRSRGNLDLLFTTDLSSMEIVLGKLMARLLPVISWVVASLPVLFIATLMGGFSADMLLTGLAVVLGTAVLSSTIAMYASLLVGRMHEALLLTYFVEVVWLLGDTVLPWLGYHLTVAFPYRVSPFSILLGAENRTMFYRPDNDAVFIWATLALAFLIVLLISLQLRHVVLRKAVRRKRTAWLSWRHQMLLNRDPLLWYEWHRRRPTLATRIIWALYYLGGIFGVGLCAYELMQFDSWRVSQQIRDFTMLYVGVGLLLTTVFAIAAFNDHADRELRDVLLATPLSTRSIVLAKWRSAIAVLPKIILFPAILLAMSWYVSNAQVNEYRIRYPHIRIPDNFWPSILANTLLILHPISCGALLASLGLFLIIWSGKFGRALGMVAGCCFAVIMVTALVTLDDGGNNSTSRQFFSAANPFVVHEGLLRLVRELTWNTDRLDWLLTATPIWIVIYFALTWVLLKAICRSFDARIRRVPESGMTRKELPPWERGILPT